MNNQLEQHMPKLEELAVEVKDLAWDGDEATLREKAGRLALSVLVLVKILRTQQQPSEPQQTQ
ncbi:hypothetical protein [Methylobacterium dankookense]|uniref:Uncharacterized protein n=1 Tax=Methylobacterium dankookense TaxID=560405 RepID=A0A564G591_9HYPH|nr:hypothetical protein [Methylobacterium dankookense]GJD57229.1 hypothetical protein IFDJLNFL_3130 [Methylobacterium dankookense]VUF15703.1 hypothetical protein MTDSW087_05447 [Methylobacterium dankookense]